MENIMPNECLLSVDIGTESGRVALLTLDGKVVANSSKEYPLYCPKAEWAEQDPDDWWSATEENIKNVLAEAQDPKVLAIGIGGQMHAPVPIGKNGELLLNRVPLWCDKRSNYLCEELKEKYDENDGLKLTGNAIIPSWTGFKMQWIKRNYPDIFKNTCKFLSCKDYLNLRLTGEMYTDYSEASATYLFDAEKKKWTTDLVLLLEQDTEKLPDIVEASNIIGKVSRQASQRTGLKEGTPVVAGGGDMMCLLLGAGVAEYGQACDITGTAADISVFVEKPLYDPRLMHIHHVVPEGGWISFGILDAGGGSFKWFKDTFCKAEVEEARAAKKSVYQLLSEKAAQVPIGSEKLLFFPYLLGERTLGTSRSRGVFFGLTPRHEIAHCVRAIMEGVTFDLNQSFEIIAQNGIDVDEIRAIGGGARSSLWCDIKANIYGKTIKTLKNFEGGVVGAAILAGIGAGIYSDAADAAERVISFDNTFHTDSEKMRYYFKQYQVYKSMHDVMQQYYYYLAKID